MTVQGYADRLEQVQSQVNGNEEKLFNLTKLLKLQIKYEEQDITKPIIPPIQLQAPSAPSVDLVLHLLDFHTKQAKASRG